MIYNLASNIDRERANKRFKELLQQETIVTLSKKVKRSTSQNSYLHLILGWFAMETGYTLNEAKWMYKKVNQNLYEYVKNKEVFMRSSRELNTEEMTISIEKFRNYSSAEAGVYLPEPSDLNFLQEIEMELGKNRYV